VTTGMALVEKIGHEDAQTACLMLGLSTRWVRRSQAFSLFDAKLTVIQVKERMGLSKSTAYYFHEEWKRIKSVA